MPTIFNNKYLTSLNCFFFFFSSFLIYSTHIKTLKMLFLKLELTTSPGYFIVQCMKMFWHLQHLFIIFTLFSNLNSFFTYFKYLFGKFIFTFSHICIISISFSLTRSSACKNSFCFNFIIFFLIICLF